MVSVEEGRQGRQERGREGGGRLNELSLLQNSDVT